MKNSFAATSHAIRPAPRVSVVMAVYNGAKYLETAVKSILGQTLQDFEFIIINDGSTDGCDHLLEKLAAKDKRIRLVHQDNHGLTKSLNRGLSLARGEFIARMDSDDIALSQRLQRQFEEFRTNPSLVLLGAGVGLIDEKGRRFSTWGQALSHAEIRRRLLQGDGGVLIHPVVMFRSAAAQNVGFYDENMATSQDLDLYLRLSEIGAVANLPEVLLLWRQHPMSVNHTKAYTWAFMKRHSVGKAIRRIGPEKFLEEVFPEAPVSIVVAPIDKARMAAAAGFYLSALKLFWDALFLRGQKINVLHGASDMLLLLANRTFWGCFRRISKLFSASPSKQAQCNEG